MHPPEELLLAVATGQADLPHRVMVEGHLGSCPSCRATAGEMSSVGGALLERLDVPELPTGHLWERLRSQIEALPPGPPSNPLLAGLPLPEGALRELPVILELRWRRPLVRGARYAVLLRDWETGSALILARMDPRRVFPRHVHLGPEDVLVLAGGYEDQWGTWEAGAYAAYAPGTEHRPTTEPDEECWTLTRLEKPNLFLGWRGWAQRLLGLG
ncbi:MAG TPA: cupin domain-containing protein [Thermoanaerobaculia bacterium]|nr:cupin domain-containing protein [Thermoanaerobaculia bacterium]